MKNPKLGSGKRFGALEKKVEKEGYSKDSAKKIAASAGRKAHGEKAMEKMAKKGKERHEKYERD